VFCDRLWKLARATVKSPASGEARPVVPGAKGSSLQRAVSLTQRAGIGVAVLFQTYSAMGHG